MDGFLKSRDGSTAPSLSYPVVGWLKWVLPKIILNQYLAKTGNNIQKIRNMILYLLIFMPKIIQNNFAKGLTEKKEKFFVLNNFLNSK